MSHAICDVKAPPPSASFSRALSALSHHNDSALDMHCALQQCSRALWGMYNIERVSMQGTVPPGTMMAAGNTGKKIGYKVTPEVDNTQVTCCPCCFARSLVGFRETLVRMHLVPQHLQSCFLLAMP